MARAMRMRRSACTVFFPCSLLLAAMGCSSGAGDGGGGLGGGGGQGGGGGAGQGGQGGADPIGGDRPVEVYVPPSYEEGTPAPLVILLHGFTVSGAVQEEYFGLKHLAESR